MNKVHVCVGTVAGVDQGRRMAMLLWLPLHKHSKATSAWSPVKHQKSKHFTSGSCWRSLETLCTEPWDTTDVNSHSLHYKCVGLHQTAEEGLIGVLTQKYLNVKPERCHSCSFQTPGLIRDLFPFPAAMDWS